MEIADQALRLLPRRIAEQFVSQDTLRAWDRADQAAHLPRRIEAVKAYEAEGAHLRSDIEAVDVEITRALASERKVATALETARQKTLQLQHRKQNLTAAARSATTRFESTMRDTAPSVVLRDMVVRVDTLLESAVAHSETHATSGRFGIAGALVISGDATDRRRSLFALRTAIIQAWPLEALSTEQYEQKFAAAIAALPEIKAPMSLEEYLGSRAS